MSHGPRELFGCRQGNDRSRPGDRRALGGEVHLSRDGKSSPTLPVTSASVGRAVALQGTVLVGPLARAIARVPHCSEGTSLLAAEHCMDPSWGPQTISQRPPLVSWSEHDWGTTNSSAVSWQWPTTPQSTGTLWSTFWRTGSGREEGSRGQDGTVEGALDAGEQHGYRIRDHSQPFHYD